MDQADEEKECGSVEVGRVWNVCHVELSNRYSALDDADEGGMEGDIGEASEIGEFPKLGTYMREHKSEKRRRSSSRRSHGEVGRKRGESWKRSSWRRFRSVRWKGSGNRCV